MEVAMFGPDHEVRVTVFGQREPGWVGYLRDAGRGVREVVREAFRTGLDALAGPPVIVMRGGVWRCERCGGTSVWAFDKPGSRWQCMRCSPREKAAEPPADADADWQVD